MAQLVINNFTRGQLDHDLNGRFDLPFYFNGFEISRNFISNYKGNIKYRTGFEHVSKPLNAAEAVLKEFRFNSEQSYLLEFTEGKLRFYTYDANGNFGIVVDEESKNRIPVLSSNSQDGYEVSDSRGNSDVYKVFNGIKSYDIGAWSTYWIQAQYPSASVLSSYKIKADSNGSPEYPDAWNLQGSNDGSSWVVLDSRNNESFSLGQEKTYTVSNTSSFIYYRISFISGRHSSGSGEIAQVQFLTTEAAPSPIVLDTGISLEQAKKLQFAQNADAMYLVMNGINPQKLKRVSASSFTIEKVVPKGIDFDEVGYPSSIAFYSGRLWYGGFSKKPLTVYGSKTAEYEEFTIPTSNIKPEDALKLTLSEITDPIEWIMSGKNNLYVGNPEGISLINGGGYDVPITSTEVSADLANKEGASPAYPAQKDSQVFYISNDRRKIYMFDYDLLTEKFLSTDLNWLSQEVTRGRLKEIYYKRDDNNIIYGLLENGQMLALLYNSRENINGWFPLETSGEIKSICTVTRPDGKDDLFMCIQRDNSYHIEKVSQETEFSKFYESTYFMEDTKKEYYNRLIAEELKICNYLDSSSRFNLLKNASITVDGDIITAAAPVFDKQYVGHVIAFKTLTGKEYGYFRIIEFISDTKIRIETMSEGFYPQTWNEWYISFNEISGLDDFEGKTVQVVADGGYLGDFTVTDGKITFDREMTSCVVGYSYLGILKSFNLGVAANGRNLQTARKRISEFVLRFVRSAGVNIGTDLSSLQSVQYFSPSGFMDLPPLPMDGDEKRTVPDSTSEEKYIFLTQNLPLPMNLTMIQYNIEFS